MKIARVSILLAAVAFITLASLGIAAPVESIESAAASTAYQKVDAFLSEQIVTEQLQALGLNHEQAVAQLAKMSDRQIEEMAAQVDLLQAGGTIQGGQVNATGPFGYIAKQFGILLQNLYRLFFSWTELK